MNRTRRQHPPRILIALLLLLNLGWPLRLYALPTAHGGGTPRLVNLVVEPYRLWLWTEPEPLRVGEAHFTIAVETMNMETMSMETMSMEKMSMETMNMERSTGTTAVDAATPLTETQAELTVQLLLVPKDATRPRLDLNLSPQSRLLQSYLSQQYYARDFALPVAGEWHGVVRIEGDAGQVNVPFAFTVAAPQPINWTVTGWGIFAVVALLGLIWARRGPPP